MKLTWDPDKLELNKWFSEQFTGANVVYDADAGSFQFPVDSDVRNSYGFQFYRVGASVSIAWSDVAVVAVNESPGVGFAFSQAE